MLGRMIPVLDKGYVRLVSHMGDDRAIVRAARVSYDGDGQAHDPERDAKLISYMVQHGHTSPFEHVVFTFEVKAPLFVMRQWHRHRTWSFNEVSARYTELEEEFYVPQPAMVGTQDKKNKQQRVLDGTAKELTVYNIALEQAVNAYKVLLSRGWPRELARAVLPVATYSRMFATVDLHNLSRFIRLRAGADAQYEIRAYAEAMKKLVTPIVPVTMAAYAASAAC